MNVIESHAQKLADLQRRRSPQRVQAVVKSVDGGGELTVTVRGGHDVDEVRYVANGWTPAPGMSVLLEVSAGGGDLLVLGPLSS